MSMKWVGAPLIGIAWVTRSEGGNTCGSWATQFLAGTGIPEESGGIRRNSGGIRVKCRNLQEPVKIPVNMAENRNLITPAKRRFLWKKSSGKKRNPEESWGILAGTKNRDLEIDIPETGIGNLACNWVAICFCRMIWRCCYCKDQFGPIHLFFSTGW